MSVRGVAGLAAVAALIAGLLLLPRLLDRRPDTVADAPEVSGGDAVLRVLVLSVEPRHLTERLATTGTVRANESVDLVSEVAGVVMAIHFDEGASVERGELLVKIDDRELQAQRDRVRHRLRLAEIREERQRDLRTQGVVSEQEYDLVDSELNVLRAELRLVEATLAKTEIRAPFAGVVGLRYVSEGAVLSPQTRIATLRDIDPVKVDFTLPERYAGRVGPGTMVEFRVKGSERAFAAEVYVVEPRISRETRSMIIRARTPNPDRELVPGAFADVTIAVNEVPDALVVPSLAVVPELGGKKVFVVEDGAAQPRPVQTGIRTETEVEITGGLVEGDRVIVSAIQRLRAGLPVDPVPAAAGGTSP